MTGELFKLNPGGPEEWEVGRHTLSRRTDPGTSHEAANLLDLGADMADALERLKASPGSTARELGDGGVRKRLNDLKKRNLAWVSGTKKCSVTGRRAQTWWPTWQEGAE